MKNHLKAKICFYFQFLWIIFIILPAITTFSTWHSWDVNKYYTITVSVWIIVVLRLLISNLYFYKITYPLVVFGLSCLFIDLTRNIDILELSVQWNTFSKIDIISAIKPYKFLIPIELCVIGIICLKLSKCNIDSNGLSFKLRISLISITTLGLLSFIPFVVWLRSWPINSLIVLISLISNTPSLSNYSIQGFNTNQRLSSATWNATRSKVSVDKEMYFLVIGETLRSDYLKECGGPSAVRPLHSGSLIACNATAGSDATHTSVPLLISRELPGYELRVSQDGTFQNAFSEVGFTTMWHGVQEESIAWTDAKFKTFSPGTDDREFFLPLLKKIISNDIKSQSIVFHTYGAHEPYCSRFKQISAPYENKCNLLGDYPTKENIEQWRLMYANAVDDSVYLLNQIITNLENASGEIFLIFTPDHGENILDDKRLFHGHALKHPTVWDIRIPIIFWANEKWKSTHKKQWQMLEKNISNPLMHADVIPTLLSSAGINYVERRELPVSLIDRIVPKRERVVQTSIGSNVNWELLVKESY